MSPDALGTAIAEFERHGLADVAYLRLHFRRFCVTKTLLEESLPRRGARVLDVGAHWLHQSYLYASDRYDVTAAEFAQTLRIEGVRSVARAMDIRLLPYDDLERCTAFSARAPDSFDVILFTEILEHLTFNPVALWRELHRLLAVGGRIVITTPNHGALRSRLRRWGRHALRGSGGLPVREILSTPTYGHHWKEYTLPEIRDYFALLSPDFAVRKALHVEDYYLSPSAQARVARVVEGIMPPLRPHLHVEVELARKKEGVTIEPRWG